MRPCRVVAVSGEPLPKSSQLARGERRYRRKIASPKQWQAIIAAKNGPCRVCEGRTGTRRFPPFGAEFHHLVSRAQLGDDTEDNIVPLCSLCHAEVTGRFAPSLQALAANLSDAEYAYCIGKLGEGALERLFGVGGSV
jgi:hypothetical protein